MGVRVPPCQPIKLLIKDNNMPELYFYVTPDGDVCTTTNRSHQTGFFLPIGNDIAISQDGEVYRAIGDGRTEKVEN